MTLDQEITALSRMTVTPQKPVELAARAIEYSSKPGKRVLDLLAGSGFTLIAAEQAGRTALLTELDPLYADVIVRRFEEHTGKKAERLAAGRAGGVPWHTVAGPTRMRRSWAALACGATAEAAAKSAGVSVRTVTRRPQDPAFRTRL